MKFGKVSPAEYAHIDFSLPPEPAGNQLILSGVKTISPRVYLGCTNWGLKDWVGKLYPNGTKSTQFLDLYVNQYNTVELNATHYQIYGPAAIQKWADKAAGKDFKFCPKVPRQISHYSGFLNTGPLTNAFLEGIRVFGENLGPVFLQVSDQLAPQQSHALFPYLEKLPKDLHFFLEVRHPDWFNNDQRKSALFEKLRALKIGAVLTDVAGRRDVMHMELTLPKAFIRFMGNNGDASNFTRIHAWAHRIKYWLDKGLQELYFFVHLPDEAEVPELTVYIADTFNKVCGLSLKTPALGQETKSSQMGLFD